MGHGPPAAKRWLNVKEIGMTEERTIDNVSFGRLESAAVLRRNSLRQFDARSRAALGIYVYGLLNPLTRRVFYVGKGGGRFEEDGGGNQRVFDHLHSTEAALERGKALNPKQTTIKEIWDHGRDVEIHFFRRRLRDDAEAFHVEAAVIAALIMSAQGKPDNDTNGNNNGDHGPLTLRGVLDKGAPLVDPRTACSVLICSIDASLNRHEGEITPEVIYQCTRAEWVIGKGPMTVPGLIAVGVQDNISRGVYSDLVWSHTSSTKSLKNSKKKNGAEIYHTTNKHSFDAVPQPEEHPLLGRNWGIVRSRAPRISWGGLLGVTFDGAGRFKFFLGGPAGGPYPCSPNEGV